MLNPLTDRLRKHQSPGGLKLRSGRRAQFLLEPLETRTLLSTTIQGTVYDGTSGTNVPQEGVPVVLQPGTSTCTDGNGDYSFPNVQDGTYNLEEMPPTGWTQIKPVSPTYQTITVKNGVISPHVQAFVNKLNSGYNYLIGHIKVDGNGCGCFPPDGPPLQSWLVEVVDPSDNLIAVTTTNSNGFYEFTLSLNPGVYTIAEVVQAGWYSTYPNASGSYSVTVGDGGGEFTGLDFSNFQLISLSGVAYNDLDGNGFPGGGEPGLEGWSVNLDDSYGNLLASTTTDSNGNYAFTGVPAGSYIVAETVPTNWVQTQPQFPTQYSFQAQSGHNLAALNFGDHSSPTLTPTLVIDHGDSGYAETGTWANSVGGFNGTNRVARTVPKGTATATASWTFSGLPISVYDVYLTFMDRSQYSNAAPFTVYDGPTPLGVQAIDESIRVTRAQGGRTQGSYGGVGWLQLGSYSISSGTLEIVLGNRASNSFVDADGVLIVQEGDSPSLATMSVSLASGPDRSSRLALGPEELKYGSLIGLTPISTDGTATRQFKLGASTPAPITVMYGGATQPAVNQASPTAIDAILGIGIEPDRTTSSNLLMSFARALLTENRRKPRST